MTLIREVIGALPPSRDNLTIRLHPADKTLADQAVSEGGEHWRVIADETLEQGGCKIETDQSLVDFSLPVRIKETLDQLYEAKAVAPKPGDPDYQLAPDPAVTAAPDARAAMPEDEQAAAPNAAADGDSSAVAGNEG
jgi:flagellar assembly protein FliH